MYRPLFFITVSFLVLGSLPAFSQIQYDVSSFGAVGDGWTDDRAALQNAINNTPSGAILNFGGSSKRYLISAPLIFQPNRKYQGQNAAILMNPSVIRHPPIAKTEYMQSDNITITGLIFDGNNAASGLQINVDGLSGVPANNVQLTFNIFRNTTPSPMGNWEGALWVSAGLTNSTVSNNQVANCGSGITILNPNSVVVADNSFDTIHNGNAISVSLSLNFELPPGLYRDIYRVNHKLRRLGLTPRPPGEAPMSDKLKAGAAAVSRQLSRLRGR